MRGRVAAGCLTLAMGAALVACDDDPDEIRDAAVPDHPCGVGAPRLELGVDRPFVENPEQRYRIHEGNQGGFHIEVSLRVRGEVDPDQADVELRLTKGDRLLAAHVNQDWLLTIEPDGCEYPLARMVLLDEEGGLLPEERLAEIAGIDLRLAGGVNTPAGNARAIHAATLELP